MSDLDRRIAENLERVRAHIAEAAARAGRTADEVRLVGVTKYVGPQEARSLLAAGLHDLGESRPQELWRKAEALSGQDVRWHLIGHLQRNKVRRTLPLSPLIHSADSLRLLTAINQEAKSLSLTAHVLLEVNVSGEAAKHGLAPDEVEPLLPAAAALRHVRVLGLMTMASLAGGREQAQRDFIRLRELRDRLAPSCPPEISLGELSMGMSDDFDVAVEEGATIVRVGSALLEGIAE
jgi:pyridoxal phosphate enzyme (YggS family)